MLDFHNHLVPGVDDGAADLEEASAAIRSFLDQGVDTIITTPHLDASALGHARGERRLAELDTGWEALSVLVRDDFPGTRVYRGAEMMLDVPTPDLTDPRVRLAGTRYALVEFAGRWVPPSASIALFKLAAAGIVPIIAHPERYDGVQVRPEIVEDWLRMGCRLQINAGSLIGLYGPGSRDAAWALLGGGHVSYVASDYHARGIPAVAAAREALEQSGGIEQAQLLFDVNPHRILQDAPPEPVPPLMNRKGRWTRLLRRLAGSGRRAV